MGPREDPGGQVGLDEISGWEEESFPNQLDGAIGSGSWPYIFMGQGED